MVKKIKKKYLLSYVVFVIAILFYVVVYFIDSDSTLNSITRVYDILLRASPSLILVYLSLMIAHLFIHPSIIMNHINGGSKFKRWFIAILSGFMSLGPLYLWYPVLSEAKKKGASPGFLVVFLSSKSISLAFIPTFILLFGVKYVAIFFLLILISSVLKGIIFERLKV